MDNTQITHVSLCAGYGGIDLGLKRAIPNLRTIAFSEIEAFACANLVAKMEAGFLDAAPIWTNLKTFPWAEFRDRVDILSGGYPCQPFSSAGKRAGADDPRHLWPFISAGIAIMRPSLCFFENVEGHISLGLPDVVEDLARLGYRTTWGIFSAAEVGAPHQRKRVFILAVSSGFRGAAGFSGSLTRHEGKSRVVDNCGAQDIWPSRSGKAQHAWEPPRVVGNAEDTNDSIRQTSWTDNANRPFGQNDTFIGQIKHRRASGNYRGNAGQTQPALGGDVDGPAGGLDYAELCVTCDNRTDELRLLGNGVVPATAERAFRTLAASF